MSKIALNLYNETTIKEIKYNIEIINERLTSQQQQIQQLFNYSKVTTTKAELHACMASLTYKNIGLKLSNESIHDIIYNKFILNEQIRSSDINSYLNNPFEAIGSLAEKVKKMEHLHKEELEKYHQENLNQKEEILSLKKMISTHETKLTQILSEIFFATSSIHRLEHQNHNPNSTQYNNNNNNNNRMNNNHLLNLNQNFDDKNKMKGILLDQQTSDSSSYWNIPEEEGLDELVDEGIQISHHIDGMPPPSSSSLDNFSNQNLGENNTINLSLSNMTTLDGQQLSSLDFSNLSSNSNINKNGNNNDDIDSIKSNYDDNQQKDDNNENNITDIRRSSISSLNNLQQQEQQEQQKIESISKIPIEPYRKSHRPSFMSTRRKLSTTLSLVNNNNNNNNDNNLLIETDEQIVQPPIKARTSVVRAISKQDSIINPSNYITTNQMNRFTSDRVEVEKELNNRIKKIENTTFQISTIHEALRVLSEEIRTISEFNTKIQKQVNEIEESHLLGFQELTKLIDKFQIQIKQISNKKNLQNSDGTSIGLETIQHELRILKQNMEGLRTQVIAQSTRQITETITNPLQSTKITTINQENILEKQKIIEQTVKPEEVLKIATDITKLDISMNKLIDRCATLQEEFIKQQNSFQSFDQFDTNNITDTINDSFNLSENSHNTNNIIDNRMTDSIHTPKSPLEPKLIEIDQLENETLKNYNQIEENNIIHEKNQDINNKIMINSLNEKNIVSPKIETKTISRTITKTESNIFKKAVSFQEYSEHNLEELNLLTDEVKKLKNEIVSVKNVSAQLFEKFQATPPIVNSNDIKLNNNNNNNNNLGKQNKDSYKMNQILEEEKSFVINDLLSHTTIQNDINTLKEKVEQVYYLALSAISINTSKQEVNNDQDIDDSRKVQLSVHQQHFPQNITSKGSNKISSSTTITRPSISASSPRKRPSSSFQTKQRPNSSIGISKRSSGNGIGGLDDEVVTPPTVSFVENIEPPLRPPLPTSTSRYNQLLFKPNTSMPVYPNNNNINNNNNTLQGKNIVKTSNLVTLEHKLRHLTESQESFLIDSKQELQIGESNSSIWDLTNNQNNISLLSDDYYNDLNQLPTSLLNQNDNEALLTNYDTTKYEEKDKNKVNHVKDLINTTTNNNNNNNFSSSDQWYRSYQVSTNNMGVLSHINHHTKDNQLQQKQHKVNLYKGVVDTKGNWNIPNVE